MPSGMASRTASVGEMIRGYARSPLVRFFAAGLVLYGLSVLRGPAEEQAPDPAPSGTVPVPSGPVVIDPAKLAAGRAQLRASLRREPTADELNRLIDDEIRTEVLVRQALRWGLASQDPVVRARLSEIVILAETGTLPATPTDQVLAAWVAAQPSGAGAAAPFNQPPRVTFVARAFSGPQAEALATRALSSFAGDSAGANPLADDAPVTYRRRTNAQVDAHWGAAVSNALFVAATGTPVVIGPTKDGGALAVRVVERVEAGVPFGDEAVAAWQQAMRLERINAIAKPLVQAAGLRVDPALGPAADAATQRWK